MNDQAPPLSSRRVGPVSREYYGTIHGLRGIAALWVVLFHAKTLGAVKNSILHDGGELTRIVFDYGRGGVAIFFVLSGFVIAHSIADKDVNLRFIGRFALRRSVRLDPPYWISILAALLFLALRAGNAGEELSISWSTILAHLFYAQELISAETIQVVYWTLTYEIQFYLVYIFVFWFLRLGSIHGGWYRGVSNVLVAALLVSAFVGALQTGEWVPRGIFLNYWFSFASGVLAYYGGCRGSIAALRICLMLACAMLFSAPQTREVFNSPAAITCIGLAALGRLKRLDSYFCDPVSRKLGDVSYSLYLIHMPALVIGISLGSRIFEPGAVGSTGIFAVAMGSALFLSFLFWNFIERPSHELAKRIRPGRDRSRLPLAQGDFVQNQPG